MDGLQFGPESARPMAVKVEEIRMAGTELASFGEREPALASECGIELAALEARTILGSGACDRVMSVALEGERMRRPFFVSEMDMKAMSRLEGVVSTASSRIAQKYMALESAPSANLGSAIQLVSGLVGLVRNFF